MRVLVISDTHGYAENLGLVLKKAGKIDALIHAGDVEDQEEYIKGMVDCPCYFIAGNNDWGSDLPSDQIVTISDYRIFLTHGHRYGVSLGIERLVDEGCSRNADIVICGHTHKPMIKKVNNIYVINPGSLTYPRQIGRKPTYIIMNINQEHDIDFSIGQLNIKGR